MEPVNKPNRIKIEENSNRLWTANYKKVTSIFRVASFMINQAEHKLTLCLSLLVKSSDGTLQPNQPNGRVAETPDGLNYSLRSLLDASLIPLIEDLFKELAMIEACNKVRKNSAGNETVHETRPRAKLSCFYRPSGWCLTSLKSPGTSLAYI